MYSAIFGKDANMALYILEFVKIVHVYQLNIKNIISTFYYQLIRALTLALRYSAGKRYSY